VRADTVARRPQNPVAELYDAWVEGGAHDAQRDGVLSDVRRQAHVFAEEIASFRSVEASADGALCSRCSPIASDDFEQSSSSACRPWSCRRA
jgi:hypothetical protein